MWGRLPCPSLPKQAQVAQLSPAVLIFPPSCLPGSIFLFNGIWDNLGNYSQYCKVGEEIGREGKQRRKIKQCPDEVACTGHGTPAKGGAE